jgi:hypothetical protein
MATQKVKNDTVVAGVAFGAGLLALLLWPNRENADQDLVFIVGLATLTVVGALVQWLAFHWRPTFDLVAFLTMTGRPRPTRPRRQTLPTLLGMLAALTFANWLKAIDARDWALTAYVVWVVLILAGVTASNIWSAHALNSGSGDSSARRVT